MAGILFYVLKIQIKIDYVEGAEEYITEALRLVWNSFDEGTRKDGGFGPYKQSERKHLYKQYADDLITKGHAYYAFDTAEALDAHRKGHEAEGKTFIYNWHNRLKLKQFFIAYLKKK